MKIKRCLLCITILLSVSFTSHAQNIINTIAGNGTGGFAGDGGPVIADSVELRDPADVLIDDTGNIIIADYENDRIRKINTQGIITTIAGIGVHTLYTGDGGPAIAANFDGPIRIALDDTGNIYVADVDNHVIRKINTHGIISTVAGTGTGHGTFNGAFSGDNGPATSAELDQPFGLAWYNGNLYIGDQKNYRIRKVDANGIITTIAGTGTYGYTGDGGLASAAEITQVTGITVDNQGNIYFADNNNNVIRKINTHDTITTIAGSGMYGYNGDGGLATAASLRAPKSVALDAAGDLFIADWQSNLIREVNTQGIILTVAGDTFNVRGTSNNNTNYGYFAGNGHPAVGEYALMYGPTAAVPDKNGNVFITDQANNVIREVTTAGATGVKQLSVSNEPLSVYPNPNNGLFTIRLQNTTQNAQIEIFNVLGENIYSAKLNSNNSSINIGNQSAGIYLYRVLDNLGNQMGGGKFVIE